MIQFRSLAQNNMAAEQVLSCSSQASAIEIKNTNINLLQVVLTLGYKAQAFRNYMMKILKSGFSERLSSYWCICDGFAGLRLGRWY